MTSSINTPDRIDLTPGRLDFVYSPPGDGLDERVAIVIDDKRLGPIVLPLTVVGAAATANRLWDLVAAVPQLRREHTNGNGGDLK